jgi:hypothetical protein
MGMLAFAGCFQVQYLNAGAILGVTSSPVSLPFDPARLIGLIVWAYICFYFAQRAQFSPLVPKNYKSMAKIAALLTGPLLLFVLQIIDVKVTGKQPGYFCGNKGKDRAYKHRFRFERQTGHTTG